MFVTLHIMLATSFGKAMALLVVCLAWAVALQWFVYKRCRPVGTKLTDDELKSLDPFDLITLWYGPTSVQVWAGHACRALAHDGYIAIDKKGMIRVHDTPRIPNADSTEHAYRGIMLPENPSHVTFGIILTFLKKLKKPSLSPHNTMLMARQLQPAFEESISRLENRGLLLSGAARTLTTLLALIPFVAGFGVSLYLFINWEVRVTPGAVVPGWVDIISLALAFCVIGMVVLLICRGALFRPRSGDSLRKNMRRTCRALEREFSHPEAGRPSGEELLRVLTVYPDNPAVRKAAALDHTYTETRTWKPVRQ
jgi:uncharacterized protein (TIGR04222 family)